MGGKAAPCSARRRGGKLSVRGDSGALRYRPTVRCSRCGGGWRNRGETTRRAMNKKGHFLAGWRGGGHSLSRLRATEPTSEADQLCRGGGIWGPHSFGTLAGIPFGSVTPFPPSRLSHQLVDGAPMRGCSQLPHRRYGRARPPAAVRPSRWYEVPARIAPGSAVWYCQVRHRWVSELAPGGRDLAAGPSGHRREP